VDLNSLLKQIAEQGIVAVYRCPHCGGKLKIGKETSETNLRICEHCGSEIETMDLADFLKTALS
jgi:DNA-directed RNA polymerase subunit RPC12/RpoP